MTVKYSVKLDGVDKILRQVKSKFKGGLYLADVGVHRARKTRRKYASGPRKGQVWDSEKGRDNVTIMRFHMSHGRNPAGLRKGEEKEILKIWLDGVNRHLRGHSARALDAAAQRVAERLRVTIVRHIQDGLRGRGKMKPLVEHYRISKLKRDGHQPILIGTGQLVRALYAGTRRA